MIQTKAQIPGQCWYFIGIEMNRNWTNHLCNGWSRRVIFWHCFRRLRLQIWTPAFLYFWRNVHNTMQTSLTIQPCYTRMNVLPNHSVLKIKGKKDRGESDILRDNTFSVFCVFFKIVFSILYPFLAPDVTYMWMHSKLSF